MWDGFFMLLSLSTVMAIASFIAGSLPLTLQLSQQRLRMVSAIGTGVLVGTALVVIIPEGIETLYSAYSTNDQRKLSSAKSGRLLLPRRQPGVSVPRAEYAHAEGHEASPHAWIGLALIVGYILMYLIDTLPALTVALSRPKALHISLSDLSQGLHHNSISPPLHAIPHGFKRAPATTIGLVIHAFADGIALGASTASSTARSNLGLVVFLAIMLHKAPAAFGLSSILLKQGLSKREVRAHLLIFSLAAPVGAFATWALVNLLGNGRRAKGQDELWWTGVVLVFSGGTFLYVAMHSMQEANQHNHSHELNSTAYLEENSYRTPQKSSKGIETGAAVIGMLLPLITQVGHAH